MLCSDIVSADGKHNGRNRRSRFQDLSSEEADDAHGFASAAVGTRVAAVSWTLKKCGAEARAVRVGTGCAGTRVFQSVGG